METLVHRLFQSWPGPSCWLLSAWLQRWIICSVAPGLIFGGQKLLVEGSHSKQRDTVCYSSPLTHLPWQSAWQTTKHSPRIKMVMAMSGGSLRRRSVGGACDHEDHPGRVCSPSVPSLSERTPPYGILHTAMVLNRRKDVIGQAVRNSERFAKQKDKRGGGDSDAFKTIGKFRFSDSVPSASLTPTFARSKCLKIWILVRTIHVVTIL